MEYSLMQLLQFRVGYHGGESRLYYPDYFSLGVGVRFMHLCFDAGYTVAKKGFAHAQCLFVYDRVGF